EHSRQQTRQRSGRLGPVLSTTGDRAPSRRSRGAGVTHTRSTRSGSGVAGPRVSDPLEYRFTLRGYRRCSVAGSNVFQKFNLKGQSAIVVLKAPTSFEPELRQLRGVEIRRTLAGERPVSFALTFVQKQAELDSVAAALTKRADGDAILWFAYPKGT